MTKTPAPNYPNQINGNKTMTATTHPGPLLTYAVDAIMEQAQVFASAWSAVDGPFDNGHMLDDANEAKAELRAMVRAALNAAAPAPALPPSSDLRPHLEWALRRISTSLGEGEYFAAAQRALDKAAAAPAQAVAVAVPELDMDRVLSIADVHAEESREDGVRLLDRGGLVAFAKDVLRVAGTPAQTSAAITVDFKQAAELLEMFGGEPAEITLMTGNGHSGNGLYASYTDMPEDGAGFLGTSDNEALPAAPAQAVAVPQGWQAVETALIEETHTALRKAQMFKLATKWTERATLPLAAQEPSPGRNSGAA